MSTVASRTFVSSPVRDAAATWTAIVELLTKGQAGPKRDELHAAAGVAASIIADELPKEAPIVVTCEGPRTRIYCLYGDDAVEGSDASEAPLGFDPLKGDWAVSLPCAEEEIDWVSEALKRHGSRVTARKPSEQVAQAAADEAVAASVGLVLDPKGFLGR